MSIKKSKTIGTAASAPEDVSRRLILKGLTAVPAIATLGAAGKAAAVSITACTTDVPNLPGAPGDIEAVSEAGFTYNCEVDGANILTNSNWGAVDVEDPIGGGVAVDNPLLGTEGDGALADTPATTLGGRRCVLYVNHNQVTNDYQLSFDSSVGNPVRASCLASLVGNEIV